MKNYVKEYKGYAVPEGATCFVEASSFNSNHFGKDVGGVEFIFCIDDDEPEWYEVSATSTPLSKRGAIELPEEKWLPDIGVKCYASGKFKLSLEECVVDFFGKDKCIITFDDGREGAFDIKNITFRPLKNQQEKEREEFHFKAFEVHTHGMSCNDFADALYDAGARFTESNK